MNDKYWAKVSRRGITERKGARTENTYLYAHLHINMNSHIYFQENPSSGLWELRQRTFSNENLKGA